MSEAKHTPGPWAVDQGGTIGHIKSISLIGTVPDGKVVRTPTVARYDMHAPSISDDEAAANARLIAAAPDLLHACRYLRRFLDEYDTANKLHPSLRQVLDAAIAKATT